METGAGRVAGVGYGKVSAPDAHACVALSYLRDTLYCCCLHIVCLPSGLIDSDEQSPTAKAVASQHLFQPAFATARKCRRRCRLKKKKDAAFGDGRPCSVAVVQAETTSLVPLVTNKDRR